jgi:uncharacterized membrane protein YkoI
MNKQQIVPLTVLALVALGGVTVGVNKMSPTVANAQSPAAQVQQGTEKADTGTETAETNKHAPTYASSIRIQESAQEMDVATEAKQLASLAKISSDQAKAAAEKSAGGTASTVKLEEENGNVVYAVTIGTKEVKVDAGNGAILHTETAEAGDSKETGGSETN